jgi:predicted  nucleic acid-binding Zn-ribbon protein
MPTKPNKLLRMVEQFEALPRQKELRQAKFQLATIADRAGQHAQELEQALGRLEVLREVQSQPELLKAEVKVLVNSLRSNAQALELHVRSGEGQAQRITAALDTLSKATLAMSDRVGEAWTSADNEVMASTEALIDLTGTYDPVAHRMLQQSLDRFKRVRAPSQQAGVLVYRQAREALMNARLSLNIPGVVGQFLSDAMRGLGSIRMLADPQVQSFLDKHPVLRTRLTVKLV